MNNNECALYRTRQGADELDLYLSKKHDELLASTLEPGSYRKTLSLVIVDGFAVEITEDQVMLIFVRYVQTNVINQIYACLIICLFDHMYVFIYTQANVLRSAKGVRVVEKNQELP